MRENMYKKRLPKKPFLMLNFYPKISVNAHKIIIFSQHLQTIQDR